MPTNNEQSDNRLETPGVKKLENGETTDATRATGNKLISSAQESLRIASEMIKIETGGDKMGARVLIPLDQSGTRFTIGQNFYNQDLDSEGSFLGIIRPFGPISAAVGAGIARKESTWITDSGEVHKESTSRTDFGMAVGNKYGGIKFSIRGDTPVLDKAFITNNLLGMDVSLSGSYNPTWTDTLNFVISKKLNIPGADTSLSLNASTERRNDEPNIDSRITANLNIYGF